MAQFLRGKQAGIQNDLSDGLNPELFFLETVAHYGINSQISTLAYDPVQSLLAVGTNESQYGKGQIYVFGQKRVNVTFTTQRSSSIKTLQFCAHRLISVDSKNDLTVFDLVQKKVESSYSPPGRITSFTCDPTLDYIFVGLQNGEVIAYDMDRRGLARLRIPCLWRDFNPRAKLVSVVSVILHPRDVGTMLIAYTDGAALYSFKQNKATAFLQYELPPGAPGGYSDASSANGKRFPKIVKATWHPTGAFILTAHEDESLVFWDPKSGNIVQAMTLQVANVNRPGVNPAAFGSTPGTFALKAPISRISWCCRKNPDETGILVAGGLPTNMPERGLTFIDLGPTPVYQTSSWQSLADHFEKPKGRHMLMTPRNADIVDVCLIPRSSPHFAGCCDPVAVIAVLSSGELSTLSFPSGFPISPTNQLHPSISFISPFVGATSLASVGRSRWLGMTEKRSRGPPLVRGGAESARTLMRFEERPIFQTAHVDGTIRMWDVGHGDEIENQEMLQLDVARALRRIEAVNVTEMSLAGSTGEFSVGVESGEVLIFKWGRNQNYGREQPPTERVEAHGLVDIQDSADPDLKEGFMPLTMLARTGTPVTALCTSEIGFVGIGYHDGSVAVIDLRGPALIFNVDLQGLTTATKGSGIARSGSTKRATQTDWPTVIEFGVMCLEGEEYSSILVFVGTTAGRLVTLKVLPTSQGTFSVQVAGSTSLESKVVSITPLNTDNGKPASATQSAVSSLRDGRRINGVILAVSATGARIFKPASAKGATKSWHEYFCDAACVASNFDNAIALIGLFGDGFARTFSIPGLKELAAMNVASSMDVRRFTEATVTPTGEIYGWSGPSEITVINVWGAGQDKTASGDQLINPEVIMPPRPTISNVQWISGTQYFTPADLDILVGGPDRPPSKRMLEQAQAEDRQRREASRSNSGTSSVPNQQDEGYWSYMQRQVQERTERLNVMGDSMNRLEESSAGWAEDVSKFVSNQKKKAVLGVIGSKFGL